MKTYKTLQLPAELIEELKLWRQAYMVSAGRIVSYGEMIRGWIDSLEDNEPDVTKAMDLLIEKHPELAEKLGKYKGLESDEQEAL